MAYKCLSYGSWGREFSPEYSPFESGLDRFVRLDKEDFIGREALLQRQNDLRYRLVTLVVEVDETDAVGGEPVISDGAVVGLATSGGFGHYVGKSLALAYVKPEFACSDAPLMVEILGNPRPAFYTEQALFDPKGRRLRS